MGRITIEKNTVQETLIIPLYARKLGNELFPLILLDPYADDVIRHLNYDFSTLDKKKGSFVWKFGALEGILRSKAILYEMQDYLSSHPDAAVVNMGCGLDQTPRLGDNGRMNLYNIDRKDIISIRNSLLPPIGREINIAADLNDDTWTQYIDVFQGVFLFAAGVFMYLREKEVHQLILRLKGAFPHGCLVFDTIGSFGIKVLMKRTLKTMGIHGIKGMFYCNNPLHDLRLDDDIKVSVRKYLTGYVDLKKEGISPLLRGMAYLFDWVFRMNICQITW